MNQNTTINTSETKIDIETKSIEVNHETKTEVKQETKIEVKQETPNNTWTVSQVASRCTPPTWEKVFNEAKDELADISLIVAKHEQTKRVIPNKEHLFMAFWYTPLPTIRVVLLSQDPYPQILPQGIPRAFGLAFSVLVGDSIPSSLNNVYKELRQEYPDYKTPNHGCLTEWAQQGVFLLNSALTVNANEPGSHGKIWGGFIRKVLQAVVAQNPRVILMLWGQKAQDTARCVSNNVTRLTAAHPSGMNTRGGFLGCGHFKEVNRLLTEMEQPMINWQISSVNYT